MTITNTFKQKHYSKTFFIILTVIDALCIYVAYHLSFWSNFGYQTPLRGHDLSLSAIWILLWIAVAFLMQSYQTEHLRHIDKIVKSTVKLLVIHACFLFVYLFYTRYYYSSLFIIDAYLFTALLSIGIRVVLLYAYRYVRNVEHNTVPYIIVGYTPSGRNIFRFLKKNHKFGYRFMGFFDDRYCGSLINGKLDDIRQYCLKHHVRQIYFALPEKSDSLSALARFADDHFIHFGLVQEVGNIEYQRLASHTYDNVPVISYEAESRLIAQPNFYRKAFLKLLKQ